LFLQLLSAGVLNFRNGNRFPVPSRKFEPLESRLVAGLWTQHIAAPGTSRCGIGEQPLLSAPSRGGCNRYTLWVSIVELNE
jgi:hypothetical protein